MIKFLAAALPAKAAAKLVFSLLRALAGQTNNGIDNLLVDISEAMYRRDWDRVAELLPLLVAEVQQYRHSRKA